MKNDEKRTFRTQNLYIYRIDYKGIIQIFILEGIELSLKKNTSGYQLNNALYAYFDVFTKQFCGTSDEVNPILISQYIETEDKKEEYTILQLKNIYKKYITIQKKEKQKMGFDTAKVNTK
jgi:hypothetical protein